MMDVQNIKFAIEEQIEKYEQNTTALCDLLTFYNTLIEEKITIESYTLLDKVIKSLENEKVNIKLKSGSIDKLFMENKQEYHKIYNL